MTRTPVVGPRSPVYMGSVCQIITSNFGSSTLPVSGVTTPRWRHVSTASQVHTKLIVGHCEACVKNELSIVYPRSFWLDSSFVRWHAAILSA